jgi:SAM-dependent methyltransferase
VVSNYVYDPSFAQERTRLAGIEDLWDPGSQALFDEVGLARGWNCLEVGAGGGSLVEWMVGRGATVTAIDIDTRFLEPLASDKVEVCCADVRADELPKSEFDLVHARLVLEHLTERRATLDRLAAALRPGGYLIIEDFDWSCFGIQGGGGVFDRVTAALMAFMQRAGSDPDYGRSMVDDIAAAGLTDVRGEGRARVIDSSSPGADFFKLSFESLRDVVVEAGLLSREDAEAAADRFAEDLRIVTPLMMAGIGRRH